MRRSPKSKDNRVLPNVSIRVLFAAYSFISDGLRLIFNGGTTDISAPVSMRNERLVILSTTKRRLCGLAEPSAAAMDLWISFPILT